jgi:hypothetical protein
MKLIYSGLHKYPTKGFLKPGLIFETGKTREIESPFRKGRCLIVKLPGLRYGLKLGVWTHNPRIDEEDHEAVAEVLLDAMNVSKKGGVKDGTWTFEEEREVRESLL